MSIWGTAQPKPGTKTELAEEAREQAAKIRTDAIGRGSFDDAAGVAKGLDTLADQLDS